MGQLEALNAYRVGGWLENGLLKRIEVASRRVAKAIIKRSPGIASFTAVAVTASIAFPAAASTASVWPKSIQHEVNQVATAIDAIGTRIDARVAAFMLDEALDEGLLAEARLTLAAIARKSA